MPRKLESTIEAQLVKYAQVRDCKVFKLGQNSEPDRLIAMPNGRCLFLEIKRDGERPRPLQAKILFDIQKVNHLSAWCDSFESGKQIIIQAMNLPHVNNSQNFLL